ncbi:MAG: hypothetical protein M1353_03255 [Nitrospirae bacterium]|nr:hypothetical protein [Nitrospirota bacterium]
MPSTSKPVRPLLPEKIDDRYGGAHKGDDLVLRGMAVCWRHNGRAVDLPLPTSPVIRQMAPSFSSIHEPLHSCPKPRQRVEVLHPDVLGKGFFL